MDYDKLISESPEYFLFNGAVGALTERHPLYANVGERVRIYFGVGGPNFTSSFHVIGEIFDNVYTFGSITSPPITNVQTVSVPPGGSTVVDFKLDRAGTLRAGRSRAVARRARAGGIPDRRRSGGRRDHASRDGGSGAGGMKQGSGAAGDGRARCQGVTAVCSMHNPCTSYARSMHQAKSRGRELTVSAASLRGRNVFRERRFYIRGAGPVARSMPRDAGAARESRRAR